MNYLNNKSLPRGIRNNNPGNLVYTEQKDPWKGKIPKSQNQDENHHFEQFTEMFWGIRAMMIDMMGDIREGKNTVLQLITEYAPSSENNVGNYVALVTTLVGIGMNDVIDLNDQTLIGLCKAMIRMENGAGYAKYVTDQDYNLAIVALDRPLKKKVKPCRFCGRS